MLESFPKFLCTRITSETFFLKLAEEKKKHTKQLDGELNGLQEALLRPH